MVGPWMIHHHGGRNGRYCGWGMDAPTEQMRFITVGHGCSPESDEVRMDGWGMDAPTLRLERRFSSEWTL